MRTHSLRRSKLAALPAGALVAAIVGMLALPTIVSAQADSGTPDKAKLEKVYPSKPGYSPYAGPHLSHVAAVRRHAPAHVVLDGRGGLRCAPHAQGRLPFRARRGSHLQQRPAGQAVAAARLPGGRRSLRRHGLLPATDGRRPRVCWPRRRAASGTTRSGRPGSRRGDRHHHELRQGPDAQGVPDAGHLGLSQCLEARPSRPPRPTTNPAASPPSSASSGPRTPAATTCTATSSSAATALRRGLVEPYTTLPPLGSDNPVDLWKWMAATEQKTGTEVLAIAHNGNLSNGIMFPVIEAFGKKIDKDYVQTRARWEPLYEMTQTKGTGETHPFLSPNDEFANFEIWDKGNLDGSVAKAKGMLEFEYARSALQQRPAARGAAGHQPLQVRPDRQQRRPHRPGRDGGRQLLRQDRAAGAQPRAHDQGLLRQREDRRQDHGLGGRCLRLRRRVGDREHARGDLRRDEAPRDLCHDRPAHGRALLRRLGLRAGRRTTTACRRPSATPRACRWAATCATRRRASHRPSSWPH